MSSSAVDFEAFVRQYEQRDLLRFLTCGSVDDGKSTMIGRLLHDAEQVFDDQLEAIRRDSRRRGSDVVDLSLLLDGLKAEREQGITIDVAYRYFSTQRRSFVIADTPGHEQYTRNMASGASTCNLAVILIDATRGVVSQTRRHAFIATLLGIKHVVVAVNKMDLVDFSEARFREIRDDFTSFAAKLEIGDVEFIPMAALHGDNIVHRSERMPWYGGRPLLEFLENVHIASDTNLIDLRFPVQYVIREGGKRVYCGTLASGVIRPGDEIVVLPSLQRAAVKEISTFNGLIEEAFAPMAVGVVLDRELDVARGSMFSQVNNVPQLDHQFDAMLVWMNEAAMQPGREYLLKQTTHQVPAAVKLVRYRMDVSQMRREDADHLDLNDIGRVSIESRRPLAFDPYARNRGTGSFILIDRITNATLAAGMILARESALELEERRPSADAGTHVRRQKTKIQAAARAERMQQVPFVLWFTGLPRSGKSSIALELDKRLFEAGYHTQVLDGEMLRQGLNADLGFSPADRSEAARRAAEAARLLAESGVIPIVALVSPSAAARANARKVVGDAPFFEIYCNAPREVCERRDTDGLYEAFRDGADEFAKAMIGTYEPPPAADLELPTDRQSIDASVDQVLAYLRAKNLVR